MKTTDTEAFKTALHLSRLIPLGYKRTEAKKLAVRRWRDAIKKALANRCN